MKAQFIMPMSRINQFISFKSSGDSSEKSFDNHKYVKLNRINKDIVLNVGKNNFHKINYYQNKSNLKYKSIFQNGNNYIAIDSNDINNNRFQSQNNYKVKYKDKVFQKKLILNISSGNKNVINCVNQDNEFHNANTFTDPNYYNVEKKINLNYSPKIDFLDRNNYPARNSSLYNKSINKFVISSTSKNYPKRETDVINIYNKFETQPSTITIDFEDNNVLRVNYVLSQRKRYSFNKRLIPFKKLNISSRKISDRYINKTLTNDNIENNSENPRLSKISFINRDVNNKIKGINEDKYFSKYMFDNINKVRTNPKYFIKYIQNGKDNIFKDKNGNSVYKGKLKVALTKGKEAFEKAIISLNEIKPMNPLIFKKELCVDFSTNEKEFRSGDYFKKKIKEKRNKGIKIKAFWRDIINDPETNFLLMIIDDNPIKLGAKRKDILNPKMKYIGINAANLGSYFVCYVVLSDE